jgi:hypothetical protein
VIGELRRWGHGSTELAEVRRHFGLLLVYPTFYVFSEAHLCACDRRWGGPSHRVLNHPHYVWIVIGWECFVAGAEIDDFACAAGPGAAAAEDFAAGEAADHEGAFGFGDVEEFAVHFFVGQDEMVFDAFDDGVAGAGDPEDFAFVLELAPFEVAAGAHEPFEDAGEVAAVEDDEAHAGEDAFVELVDDFIDDVVVGHVSPPGHDVGVLDHVVGQAVHRLIEGGGADFQAGGLAEVGGDDLPLG